MRLKESDLRTLIRKELLREVLITEQEVGVSIDSGGGGADAPSGDIIAPSEEISAWAEDRIAMYQEWIDAGPEEDETEEDVDLWEAKIKSLQQDPVAVAIHYKNLYCKWVDEGDNDYVEDCQEMTDLLETLSTTTSGDGGYLKIPPGYEVGQEVRGKESSYGLESELGSWNGVGIVLDPTDESWKRWLDSEDTESKDRKLVADGKGVWVKWDCEADDVAAACMWGVILLDSVEGKDVGSGASWKKDSKKGEPTKGDRSTYIKWGHVDKSPSSIIKRIQIAVGVDDDGKFGNDTYNAVKRWQKEQKLGVDGIVGGDTWARIKSEEDKKDQPSDVPAATKPGTKDLTSAQATLVKKINKRAPRGLKITFDGSGKAPDEIIKRERILQDIADLEEDMNIEWGTITLKESRLSRAQVRRLIYSEVKNLQKLRK